MYSYDLICTHTISYVLIWSHNISYDLLIWSNEIYSSTWGQAEMNEKEELGEGRWDAVAIFQQVRKAASVCKPLVNWQHSPWPQGNWCAIMCHLEKGSERSQQENARNTQHQIALPKHQNWHTMAPEKGEQPLTQTAVHSSTMAPSGFWTLFVLFCFHLFFNCFQGGLKAYKTIVKLSLKA